MAWRRMKFVNMGWDGPGCEPLSMGLGCWDGGNWYRIGSLCLLEISFTGRLFTF